MLAEVACVQQMVDQPPPFSTKKNRKQDPCGGKVAFGS
jgi:hypothetical protein